MSELNVDIYSSGFLGVSADNPTKQTEKVKLIAEQEGSKQTRDNTNINTREVIEEVNDFLYNMNRNLSFSIDEDSGDSIILIKDSDNDEVIRQIPSEELLVIRKKMDYLVGILFETKV